MTAIDSHTAELEDDPMTELELTRMRRRSPALWWVRLRGPRRGPRPAGARPLPTAWAVVVRAMLALSMLAAAFLVYALGASSLQESRSQHVMYAALREQLASATTPLGGAIDLGTPVLLLSAPRAGLPGVVVVEGTSSGVLQLGPGHLRDTPLPGQPGVSVLMGRSVTFGGPFAHIASLRVGDILTATTGQGIFKYVVSDVRRNGDPLPPPLAAGTSRLLLISSEGSGWQGGWAPSNLVFVDAALQGAPQPAPPGRLAAVPASDLAMAGDTGTLVSLFLWLQALLLASVAIVWTRARWGAWQTWVIGVPVIAALVWACLQSAIELLPNLL